MSGETESQVSGWTTDTLHAHIERQRADMELLLAERDRRYSERFTASQEAIKTALASLDKRLDGLNELRSGVATTAELQALGLRIADLKERVDKGEGSEHGQRSQSAQYVTLASLAVAIIVAVVIFMNSR